MPPKEDFTKLLDLHSQAYNEATNLLFSALTKRLDDQFKYITELKVSLEYTQAECKDIKDENLLLKSDLINLLYPNLSCDFYTRSKSSVLIG